MIEKKKNSSADLEGRIKEKRRQEKRLEDELKNAESKLSDVKRELDMKIVQISEEEVNAAAQADAFLKITKENAYQQAQKRYRKEKRSSENF